MLFSDLQLVNYKIPLEFFTRQKKTKEAMDWGAKFHL